MPTAASAALTLTIGGQTHSYTSADVLARADVATIAVARDPSYPGAMNYRAAPLRALLAQFPHDASDTLEIRATDGFVAQLPRALIDGASTPWIAVEDPAHPWPNLPNKSASAGPFYLIWQNPELAHVSPEQWPYQMASITAVASPAQRWPSIAVAARAPAQVRRGQVVFAANCLTCHKLAGAGEGDVGPDLLQPMSASAYFTTAGLRALIRNPASVRTWPNRRMPAFNAETISDADVDAVIAYLHYLGDRPRTH